MTKQNETKQQNNFEKEIDEMLQQWKQQKETRKESNAFFKVENRIAFVDEINQKAINLVIKDNNKIGFQKIFDSDIFKIYLKKFYESNGVFWLMDKGKLCYLIKDGDKNKLLSCIDYSTYAFNIIEERKKKEREEKEKLSKVKTGVDLSKLNERQLQALIMQAKQLKKENKKA